MKKAIIFKQILIIQFRWIFQRFVTEIKTFDRRTLFIWKYSEAVLAKLLKFSKLENA